MTYKMTNQWGNVNVTVIGEREKEKYIAKGFHVKEEEKPKEKKTSKPKGRKAAKKVEGQAENKDNPESGI